ncbi:MAG: FHA domain-containing protein [Gammaproteobacteria bacterium]|nr:MAG: FHA domain-containing protein [Gammaproteobacteria bacterium]
MREAIADGAPCAVVTGDSPAELAALLRRCLATAPVEHAAHVVAETACPRAFLESLLAQFGFEPISADEQELLSLLRIFLQHEGRHGRRSLLAIEEANRFGPRVWQLLQELLSMRPAPLTLLLSGDRRLLQVLESPAMQRVAALTRRRWRLGHGSLAPPAHCLQLSRNGEILGRVPLRQRRLLIGRQRQNDLPLPSHYVSRHHALLSERQDGYLLVDLNSTNGTYVNGAPVRERRLVPGDLIAIGDYRLRLLEAAPAAGPPAGWVPEGTRRVFAGGRPPPSRPRLRPVG